MASDRQSITFKVIIGYLLFAVLAGVAVWFVYSQVRTYTDMAEAGIEGNQKLYLVGDAAADLYEAESLSRQLIQSGSSEDLTRYQQKVEEIEETLDALTRTYKESFLIVEVDSIRYLLAQKTNNLQELLHLRSQQGDQSYYSKVLNELQRMNGNFGEPDYEARWTNLEPHQRRYLQKLLEFSDLDAPNTVTSESLDSLVSQVKSVLIDFETADREYRRTLRATEDELLASEIEINGQLRSLLSAIEEEEREASVAQVNEAQEMVRNTSLTIAILGAASFLVILIFLFLVIKDVSRSQRYRVQLEDAKQYTEALLKTREQFMATVTHDLRSPLNTVEGYTDLLQNTNLNNTQSHYLKQLKSSSAYILRLVNDLLDMAKLEAGKMSIEIIPFNPRNLIEDTVQNAIPARPSEVVEVKVEIDPALNRPIKSDPFRIRQILTNLITNAIKFTEEGEVKITAELNNKGIQSRLVIAVKDTGIGISEKKKGQIFEEFSQEDSSIEKRFGGSGLGLAITKKLTELLDGDIKFHSTPGKGSVFVVSIPIQKAELTREIQTEDTTVSIATNLIPATKEGSEKTAYSAQENQAQKSTADNQAIMAHQTKEETQDQSTPLKALLVDDEPAQLGLISEFIRSTGLEFETAANGKEALNKLESEKFDIILTDIQMPSMDGFDLLEAIKANPEIAEIPIIALSGRADVSKREYLEKGFTGSLLKPYSSKKLLGLIEQSLNISLNSPFSPSQSATITDKQFSLEEIRMFASGEQEALNSILSIFIDSTLKNLEALQDRLREGKKEEIQKIAHKMLPMFRQLKVHSIVHQLEFLETTDPQNIVEQHFLTLRKETNQLLKELGKEIGES